MKNDKNTCNSNWLNSYLDGELPLRDVSWVESHLDQCPYCRKAVEETRDIAALFQAGMDTALSQAGLEVLETRVLAAIDQKKKHWWSKLGRQFISKRFFVPATAVVAALAIVAVLMMPAPSVSGPSAIVSSLKSDAGSVMILETPRSHQTVIWFHEPAPPDGRDSNRQPEGSAILELPTHAVHIA